MSNSLDPDQDRYSVCPDLGPNCLQRLSADGTSRQRDKQNFMKIELCLEKPNNVVVHHKMTQISLGH